MNTTLRAICLLLLLLMTGLTASPAFAHPHILRAVDRSEVSPAELLRDLAGLLVILVGLECFLLFTRSDVRADLLRAPGSLYQEYAGGWIGNVYQLRLRNKTTREVAAELRLEGREGRITVPEGRVVIPAQQSVEVPVLIELPGKALDGASTKIRVGVYDAAGRRFHGVKTGFIGPRQP